MVRLCVAWQNNAYDIISLSSRLLPPRMTTVTTLPTILNSAPITMLTYLIAVIKKTVVQVAKTFHAILTILILRLIQALHLTFCLLAPTTAGRSSLGVRTGSIGHLLRTLVLRSLVTWTSVLVASVQPVATIVGSGSQSDASSVPSELYPKKWTLKICLCLVDLSPLYITAVKYNWSKYIVKPRQSPTVEYRVISLNMV